MAFSWGRMALAQALAQAPLLSRASRNAAGRQRPLEPQSPPALAVRPSSRRRGAHWPTHRLAQSPTSPFAHWPIHTGQWAHPPTHPLTFWPTHPLTFWPTRPPTHWLPFLSFPKAFRSLFGLPKAFRSFFELPRAFRSFFWTPHSFPFRLHLGRASAFKSRFWVRIPISVTVSFLLRLLAHWPTGPLAHLTLARRARSPLRLPY